jgi:two-component system chemotaxis sensor kinase CheA
MDHGIEADEERLECGKSEKGLVLCQIARQDDNYFSIRISDDGRGINLDRLRSKAAENNIYTQTELESLNKDEIINLIFADKISTKDSADTLSGRGVGMPAFKAACQKLGGKVEITTKEGLGTTFIITLPLAN